MFRLSKNDRGFTLVELMMVVVILGILAGVAVPMMGNMRQKAVVNKLLVTEDTVATAILIRAVELGELPDDPRDVPVQLPGNIDVKVGDPDEANDNIEAGRYVVFYEPAEDGASFTLTARGSSGKIAATERTYRFSDGEQS